MRKLTNINQDWSFIKDGVMETVNLPHTWNAIDGQGGAEGPYYRGRCVYEKTLPGFEGRTYIEITGANTVCEVFINGVYVGSHENGYAMFRFEITDFIKPDVNTVRIIVDNSENEFLYPQMADFTFYGGIYRDVNIISDVAESHFALLDMSLCGMYITPKADGRVFVKSLIEGSCAGLTKEFVITDAEGNEVAKTAIDADVDAAKLIVDAPTLWDGVENPYLYTMTARLIKDLQQGMISESEVETRIANAKKEWEKESTKNYSDLESKYNDLEKRNGDLTTSYAQLKLENVMTREGFKEENFKEVAKMRESLYGEEKDDVKAIQEIKEKFKSTYFPESQQTPFTKAPNEAGVKGSSDVKPSEPIKITRDTSFKDLISFKK
jgi:hypothetical protein